MVAWSPETGRASLPMQSKALCRLASLLKGFIYFYFECKHLHHMQAVPTVARRGHRIPPGAEITAFVSLGTGPGSSCRGSLCCHSGLSYMFQLCFLFWRQVLLCSPGWFELVTLSISASFHLPRAGIVSVGQCSILLSHMLLTAQRAEPRLSAFHLI